MELYGINRQQVTKINNAINVEVTQNIGVICYFHYWVNVDGLVQETLFASPFDPSANRCTPFRTGVYLGSTSLIDEPPQRGTFRGFVSLFTLWPHLHSVSCLRLYAIKSTVRNDCFTFVVSNYLRCDLWSRPLSFVIIPASLQNACSPIVELPCSDRGPCLSASFDLHPCTSASIFLP